MPKKDWEAEFKKITYSKGVDSLKMEITPYRDWRIVVFVFFFTLALSIGFNIYLFIEINSDTFFTVAPRSAGVIKFNEEGLAKVITLLDENAATFDKIKSGGLVIDDPSL